MAVSAILLKTATKQLFTQTLASLAASSTGTGRQATMVANAGSYPAAMVYLAIMSGATPPTLNTVYEVYLLRGDDASASTYRTDAAGAADAGIVIENAVLLGTIKVTATANKKFYGEFDTKPLGPLGPEWGIAIVNNSGQALNPTEANHFKGYVPYNDESQ